MKKFNLMLSARCNKVNECIIDGNKTQLYTTSIRVGDMVDPDLIGYGPNPRRPKLAGNPQVKAMRDTIENDPISFPAINKGIHIACKDLYIDPTNEKNISIRLTDGFHGIADGATTANVLWKMFANPETRGKVEDIVVRLTLFVNYPISKLPAIGVGANSNRKQWPESDKNLLGGFKGLELSLSPAIRETVAFCDGDEKVSKFHLKNESYHRVGELIKLMICAMPFDKNGWKMQPSLPGNNRKIVENYDDAKFAPYLVQLNNMVKLYNQIQFAYIKMVDRSNPDLLGIEDKQEFSFDGTLFTRKISEVWWFPLFRAVMQHYRTGSWVVNGRRVKFDELLAMIDFNKLVREYKRRIAGKIKHENSTSMILFKGKYSQSYWEAGVNALQASFK